MKLRRRDSGEETELTPGLVVGRLAECGLKIQDGSVSRRHAKLERRGEQWWVVDLGSSNGTLRNGERGQEFELRGGDLVTFGAVAFEFVVTPPTSDFGDEISIEDDSAPEVHASESAVESVREAAPAISHADQERARLRQELKQSKRSSGLGDLSQLSFGMQLLVGLLAIAVVAVVVLGVRYLSGAITSTA
ncbi:MAG: FHA domain-containing protein [Planctomycetes bacterium]|nr:FHA domain-containing protein [Planctomycetota bacterium]